MSTEKKGEFKITAKKAQRMFEKILSLEKEVKELRGRKSAPEKEEKETPAKEEEETETPRKKKSIWSRFSGD